MFSSFIIQEISIEIFNTVGYVTRRYFWEKGCGKKKKVTRLCSRNELRNDEYISHHKCVYHTI